MPWSLAQFKTSFSLCSRVSLLVSATPWYQAPDLMNCSHHTIPHHVHPPFPSPLPLPELLATPIPQCHSLFVPSCSAALAPPIAGAMARQHQTAAALAAPAGLHTLSKTWPATSTVPSPPLTRQPLLLAQDPVRPCCFHHSACMHRLALPYHLGLVQLCPHNTNSDQVYTRFQ